jgi:hypothetical protein
MIHYHGADITPQEVGRAALKGKHVLFSFLSPRDIKHVTGLCQSYVFDCGAYNAFTSGKPITEWEPYYDWVDEWRHHPGFDWAVIPDVIDGDERANRRLLDEWCKRFDDVNRAPWAKAYSMGVPVWHPHESMHYLRTLAANFRTVAIGGSRRFPLGRKAWWHRIDEAFRTLSLEDGTMTCRVHGMRMLNPKYVSRLPMSSADSSSAARNGNNRAHGRGSFHAPTLTRVRQIIDRLEAYNSPARYVPQVITHNHLFSDAYVLPKLQKRPRK